MLCVVLEQINELNETVKNMELDIFKYKKKWEDSETKLRDQKHLFKSVRSEHNLCSKSLREANVSDG